MSMGECKMSERMPRCSELARGRLGHFVNSGGWQRALVLFGLFLMVSAVFAPLLTNVQAVSLNYSNSYNNPTDVTITDGSCLIPKWVTSTVTVTDNVVLDRVDVNADIPRAPSPPSFGGRERDLIVTLSSPSGTTVVLWNRQGNLQDLAINQPNVGFVDENALGVWTLSACDAGNNNQYNYINDFSITIYWNFHLTIERPVSGNPISTTAYTVQADSNGNSAELWMDSNYVADMSFNGGTGYWEYTLDTTAYHNGMHNLEVIAKNGLGDKLVAQMGVQVQNYQFTVNMWPADGTTLVDTVQIYVSGESDASRATLSIDGIIISTLNGNPNFIDPWYRFDNINTANFQDGMHLVTGTVYDPDGNPTATTVTYFFNNYPISCTITDPPNPGFVISSSPYTVKATVPSTAVKGELYVDGVLTMITMTIDISSQYTFDLVTKNYKDGAHLFEVKAYNKFGTTASDVMNVQFSNFNNFFVNIDNHINGEGVSGDSANPVIITANTNPYALKGDLYIDQVLVAEDNSLDASNDFSFSFNPQDYKDGRHNITVRAYDPDGAMAQSSIDLIFQDWNIYAFIYTPLNGDTITLNKLTLKVNAFVPDDSTDYGDLYVDNQWVQRLYYTIGSGAWELDFSFNTTSYPDGSHTLKVVAYTPDGVSASASITVTFKRWTISATITSPLNGATIPTIQGQPTTVRVATQWFAQKGEVYVDGTLAASSTNLQRSGAIYYYDISVVTRAYKDGSHSLTARAYNPDGNFAVSPAIMVTIKNINIAFDITTPPDAMTPSLSNQALPITATITSGGTDIIKGECYVDDKLIFAINAAPTPILPNYRYSFTINTFQYSDSTHMIKVIIYDSQGTAYSHTHTVSFKDFTITALITSPANNALITSPPNMNIVATVPWYAKKGEFYIDDTFIGTDTLMKGNPNWFSYSVDTRTFYDGPHMVTVKAYDPDGNFAIDTRFVTFANYNINVRFDQPSTANQKKAGQVTVVAYMVAGPADSAKLYVDNSLVATSSATVQTDNTYTFTIDSGGFVDGNHILRVEVAYSRSGESAFASRAVQFDNTPPTLEDITVIYLNGLTAVRASGDQVVITAKATDAPAGINRVTLDASNIGAGSSISMFDDGAHHDGGSGDGVYGTDPVDASGKMGFMRVFVTATDNVGNTAMQSVSVAIDDHLPIITNTYIVYPGAQTAAKTGDDVRVIANIVDTRVFVDVVLILDNSNSIKANFGTVQSDAKDFVDSLNPNDRAAVYDFNGENGPNSLKPKREIGFTLDKDAVKDTIDNIVADDGTPLYDTIYDAVQYAKANSNNLPVIVVLTDGNDLGYSAHPITDVEYASIPIFTIGLEPGSGYDPIDEDALTDIADTSNGGAYYYSPDVSQLQDIYKLIAAKIKAFEVGGISYATVDLMNIGAGSSNPLYDDGSHGDGAAKDNVFGSNMITITSVDTDQFNYTVTAGDVGGNIATLIGIVKIDNTPPSVTLVKPVFQTLNWWAADGDTVQFTATVSDPGKVGGILSVRMDATSIGGGPNVVMRDDGTNGDVKAGDGIYTSDQVQVSTGLSTGIMTVTVFATDIAANLGSGAGNIYIDNHRPMVIEIVNPTIGQYIEEKYTFQVRSNDVEGTSQVQIKIDKAWHTMAYNAQSSYYEYIMDTKTLSDGAYKTSVQVSDISGKVVNGPTDQLFYIDNTPPTLVLNSPNDGDVVLGSFLIDTTGTTDKFLAGIDYKADDLAWNNISVPWDTTDLVDGLHTLVVRAKDKIGHETTRTITVIVDNGLPTAYFVTPAANAVLTGKVTFQIKASDDVQVIGVVLTGNVTGIMEYNSGTGYYELQVDTTLKPDGTFTVGALVGDPGNNFLVVAPVTFYIDNNVPVVKIIKPVNNAVLVGNVSVQLNVTDGPFQPVSILWRVDDGPWKTVTAQSFWWNTTTYQDAKHTFYVQATDMAGHLVQSSVPIIIDNTPPTVDLANPVNGQVIYGTYIFKMHAYSAVGIDKVVLQITNVNNWTIINNVGTVYFEQSVDTTAIKDGSYYVTATAYDIAGHSTKTTKIKVNINNVAPKLTVTSPTSNEFISGTNYTVKGSAQGLFVTSIEYDIDGQGARPINQTINTTILADGQHTITVTAKDQAGHVTTYSVKVYIDNQKPSVSPVAPQPLEPVSGKYTFKVRAEDINGIGTVKLIYGNFTLNMFQNSVTGYYEVTRDTTLDGDGPRSFLFSVMDRSGKLVNLTVQSHIDNTAPNVTVVSPGSDSKGVINYKLDVTDASGIDTVLIRIGGGDWREMRFQDGQYQFKWKSVPTDNGDQPYDIKATDKLGNSQIYSYNLYVSNPSSKQNYDWLWWFLFVMLIVCMVAVALTSRSKRSSAYPRDGRAGPRGYDTRMAAEEGDEGMPRPLPGRMAGPDGARQTGGQSRELGTPAHRVAIKKLDGENVVVSQPQQDEVTFMSTEDDMAQAPMMVGALKSTSAMDQGQDDVQFLDEDAGATTGGDEVSFEEDAGDEVSFSDDSGDDVEFLDDATAPASDEVSFSDDSGDDVQFLDDSAPAAGGDEDVEFLDDEAPPAPPAPKPPERRVPVALTPRKAQATPTVTAKRPPPTVSKDAIAGIDDLLGGGGGSPGPKSRAAKPSPAKAKQAPPSGANPLEDVIGQL